MRKICIIPARMDSTRFPGKPLKEAVGIPVVIHIAKRCQLLSSLDFIAVATCDQEIKEACVEHNINVIMTRTDHERCTDRISEAVNSLSAAPEDSDLIIMVQGDEILITPDMLQLVIEDYQKHNAPVVNLLSTIYQKEDYLDPNVVKVVSSPCQKALYFSRAPIPSDFRDAKTKSYQQTGVIGFSRQFLDEFSRLPQTPLEKTESIDMLRVLEHGLPLRVVYTDKETVAIDTPYDLERAQSLLENDPLVAIYA